MLMSVAFLGFMTTGQLAYNDDFGAVPVVKPARRRTHAALMALAFVFALAGYVAIWYAHHANGESEFGIGETWSRALHVALGYPVLLWTVAQASSGALKARALEPADPAAEPARVYTWHGASGKWCLVGGYAMIALGYWLKMNGRSGFF